MLPLSGSAIVEAEGRRFVLEGTGERLRARQRLGIRPGRRGGEDHERRRRRGARARVGARGAAPRARLRRGARTSRSRSAVPVRRRARSINFLAPEAFEGADRLICVEVLTPDGNWSSYPPHKHDDTPDQPRRTTRRSTTSASAGRAAVDDERRGLRPPPHVYGRRLHRRDRRRARRRRLPRPARLPRPLRGRARLPLYYLNVMAGPEPRADDGDRRRSAARAGSAARGTAMEPDPRCPMGCGGRARMRPRVGIGVVGFGWMGQAHSRSYRAHPDALRRSAPAEPELVVCATAPGPPGQARAGVRVPRGGRRLACGSCEHLGVDASSSPRRTCSTSKSSRPPARRGSTSSARSPSGGTPAQTRAPRQLPARARA